MPTPPPRTHEPAGLVFEGWSQALSLFGGVPVSVPWEPVVHVRLAAGPPRRWDEVLALFHNHFDVVGRLGLGLGLG